MSDLCLSFYGKQGIKIGTNQISSIMHTPSAHVVKPTLEKQKEPSQVSVEGRMVLCVKPQA